jgi:hypothetical protein
MRLIDVTSDPFGSLDHSPYVHELQRPPSPSLSPALPPLRLCCDLVEPS